ncbi:MAG: hypothetical protein EXS64_13385 [Candidatus Latescibacteria bacterium]|nr:hypothetical protein [Candidatus Latescibacterota bacterium]
MRVLLDLVKKRVEVLIQTYQPKTLVVEWPSRKRFKASPALPAITARIREVALASSLHFCICDSTAVRRRLCGQERTTRKKLVVHIVAQYPHLGRYKDRSSQWGKSYWLPMFAAVGVGLACQEEIQKSVLQE